MGGEGRDYDAERRVARLLAEHVERPGRCVKGVAGEADLLPETLRGYLHTDPLPAHRLRKLGRALGVEFLSDVLGPEFIVIAAVKGEATAASLESDGLTLGEASGVVQGSIRRAVADGHVDAIEDREIFTTGQRLQRVLAAFLARWTHRRAA